MEMTPVISVTTRLLAQVAAAGAQLIFEAYAHVYHAHLPHVSQLGMTQHLNTCFKRFTHFVLRCELLEPEDMAPLQGLVRAQWHQRQLPAADIRLKTQSWLSPTSGATANPPVQAAAPHGTERLMADCSPTTPWSQGSQGPSGSLRDPQGFQGQSVI